MREEGGGREGERVITKYCSVNLRTHRAAARKIVFIHHQDIRRATKPDRGGGGEEATWRRGVLSYWSCDGQGQHRSGHQLEKI